MAKLRSLWNSLIELIHDLTPIDWLVLLITITGINIQIIIENLNSNIRLPSSIIVLITIVLLGFTIAFFGGKRGAKTRHIFGVNSTEEALFFDQWYRGKGRLIIFCTDLEWLEGEAYSRVRDALAQKGNRLDMYLKEYDHSIVNGLVGYGARLHRVRKNIRSVHRFSILLDNGFHSIIIRNKETESGRIQIDEYNNNPALANLALDMLDDCEEID